MTLRRRDLSYYDEASKTWKLDPGRYDLLLGSTAHDIRLCGSVNVP